MAWADAQFRVPQVALYLPPGGRWGNKALHSVLPGPGRQKIRDPDERGGGKSHHRPDLAVRQENQGEIKALTFLGCTAAGAARACIFPVFGSAPPPSGSLSGSRRWFASARSM